MTGRRRAYCNSCSNRRSEIVLWLLVIVSLGGCASDPMGEVHQLYHNSKYGQARELLKKLEKDDSRNRHVYLMERGIVELALGEPQEAERALREARDRLGDLVKPSLNGYLGAVLFDDRQIDYAGSDYENVLVRAVLAIANLMHGGGDADAYALQVLEKQQEIIESFHNDDGYQPKQAYKLVALGAYIRAILNEADPLKLGVARASYKKVKDLVPNFAYVDRDLARVTDGVHSEKGNGVVHLIAFVGQGPYRVETEEPVSRNALAIAQVIWARRRGRVPIPNITSVKISEVAYRRHNPSTVYVSVNGQQHGQTAIVTDVESMAKKEFAVMKSYIVARAVLRRALKIVGTEEAREAVKRAKKGSSVEGVLDTLVSGLGLIWTGVERADLRCWSLLPASFQVLRIELPAGEHELVLSTRLNGRPGNQGGRIRVLVRDGFNTYVVVHAPTVGGAPATMVSDPA